MGWDGWPGVAPDPSVRLLLTAGRLVFEPSSYLRNTLAYTQNLAGLRGTLQQVELVGTYAARFQRV